MGSSVVGDWGATGERLRTDMLAGKQGSSRRAPRSKATEGHRGAILALRAKRIVPSRWPSVTLASVVSVRKLYCAADTAMAGPSLDCPGRDWGASWVERPDRAAWVRRQRRRNVRPEEFLPMGRHVNPEHASKEKSPTLTGLAERARAAAWSGAAADGCTCTGPQGARVPKRRYWRTIAAIAGPPGRWRAANRCGIDTKRFTEESASKATPPALS